ncbi:MAG TPA: hypothetical protein VJY41_05085 [Prolixibacteraceae bacterium]|nr:hypothetical protein [Prolixibacteraceae bacterium]
MKTITFLAIAIAALIMPIVVGAKTNETKNVDSNHFNMNVNDNYIEENLEIQAWMTSDSVWQLNQKPSNIFSENTIEGQLNIESWMTDDKLWFGHNEEVANSQNLKIESWMTDSKYWRL